MKTLEKRYFVSWLDMGAQWATALMSVGSDWFDVAINVFRGSDRGQENEWVTDHIWEEDAHTIRPATIAEVRAFMRRAWKSHCDITGDEKRVVELVLDKEPYILFECRPIQTNKSPLSMKDFVE